MELRRERERGGSSAKAHQRRSASAVPSLASGHGKAVWCSPLFLHVRSAVGLDADRAAPPAAPSLFGQILSLLLVSPAAPTRRGCVAVCHLAPIKRKTPSQHRQRDRGRLLLILIRARFCRFPPVLLLQVEGDKGAHPSVATATITNGMGSLFGSWGETTEEELPTVPARQES